MPPRRRRCLALLDVVVFVYTDDAHVTSAIIMLPIDSYCRILAHTRAPATAEHRQGDGPGGDVTTLVSATRPAQTQLLKNAKEKKVRRATCVVV